MDQLTALRVFRAIVGEGSFAAAARRLRLSPAAVSKNIAELEASLGVRLLNRTTRRLSLTEAGEIYAERTGRVLSELDDADRTLAALSGDVSGRLRVSAPLTLGLIALSPRIPGFLQRHPRLSLDLDLDDRRVEIVRDGFDIVVRGGAPLEDSGLIARPVATLRYAVCASPGYLQRRGTPATPEAVRGHDLVQFSLPSRSRPWVFEAGGRQVDVPVDARLAVTSSLAIRDALKAGLGLGRIPALYVRDELAAGELVEVLPAWSMGTLEVFALYPSRRHVVPKTAAFLEFLVEAFQAVGRQ